jgi:enamine deaminase RidA (YjgF/YER057c/UK114 family)
MNFGKRWLSVSIGFDSDAVWKAHNRGFQMAVVQHPGQIVHFTGQVAWDADEKLVGKGDIKAQTRQCFENIKQLLAEVNGTLDDIVAITTYFTDRKQLLAIQEIRTEYFSATSAPVSTSVMVAGLGHEDFLVELAPIVVIPNERYAPPGRNTLE